MAKGYKSAQTAYVMTCIPLQQQKASSLGTLAAKCLPKMDIITNLSMGWRNSEKHCFKAFFCSFCHLCLSQLGQKTTSIFLLPPSLCAAGCLGTGSSHFSYPGPTENLGQLFFNLPGTYNQCIVISLRKRSARGKLHRGEDKPVNETSQSSGLLLQEKSQCRELTSPKHSREHCQHEGIKDYTSQQKG